MPTVQEINRKITAVLGTKTWAGFLNYVPIDHNASIAFNSLLDYIDMLQKQIKGLEEEIRKIK